MSVNPDADPNNTVVATRTPADTGAVRQMEATPLVTASKLVAIGVALGDAGATK